MAGNFERKIIFSRNNIKLEKIEHTFQCYIGEDIFSELKTFGKESTSNDRGRWDKPKKGIKKEITLKSPLGFYYTKTIIETKEEKNNNDTWSIVFWKWSDKNKTSYMLSYPIRKNDTEISIETRPWEILNNEAFPTRIISILEKEIKAGLDIIKNRSLADEKRKKIFTDLFGYPEGPKFQTDEEKILSHGFDLKESFRKRKEN